jgi:WD40 repeat protein
LWDVLTRQGPRTSKTYKYKYWVQSAAFSPDGTRLATAGADGSIELWDAFTGQELLSLKAHTSTVDSVAFSPDGTRLASASWDTTVKLWDVDNGQELRPFKGHNGMVSGVAFSPDGARLATTGVDGTRVWDVATGRELRTRRAHSESQRWCVTFSPDGTRLAAQEDLTVVKLWDAASGQERSSLKTQWTSVRSHGIQSRRHPPGNG